MPSHMHYIRVGPKKYTILRNVVTYMYQDWKSLNAKKKDKVQAHYQIGQNKTFSMIHHLLHNKE